MEDIFEHFFSILKSLPAKPDKVFDYQNPSMLRKAFDFSLCDEGLGPEALKDIISRVFQFTPNVNSPTYLNYFYSAPDPVGIIGDWLAALANTNVHAYEASPFFCLAEMELVQELGRVIGHGDDGLSDGIFCPGGSYSNMLATYLARNRAVPETIRQGLSGNQRLVMLASEQAHYSFDRAAAFLGLGTDAVIKIKCDPKGRMMPDDLKRKIAQALEKGEKPFMVGATLGSTVLGAFDPLTDIQEVLSDYPGIWLHVDAAWGGAVFMSSHYSVLCKGIEHADSVTWDFHKALSAPILCSVLLVKNGSHLNSMFRDDTSYLFHRADESPEDGFNLGEKTPQCGRRADAFKFWLMWKMMGKKHFETEVVKRFEITYTIIKQIKTRDCLLLLDDCPDYWNICFWYIPSHLRHMGNVTMYSDEAKKEVSELTVAIHQHLKKDGRILINYAQIPGMPAFLRFVVNNSRLDESCLTGIFDAVESFGKTVSPSLF